LPDLRISNHPLERYLVAIAAVGVAFFLRLGLSGFLDDRFAYITLTPAVMLTAALCGLGPGLAATAASTFLAWVWILPPTGHLFPLSGPDTAGLVAFSGTGVFMSVVAALYHRARGRLALVEKHVAEEALRAAEQLRLAQDAAKMGSWDLNLKTGEIVGSDRAKDLFGLAPDALVTYDRFLGAVHPEDRDRIDRAVKDALASRADYDVEMRVPLPDGTVRWVCSKGRGIYDAGGSPLRMAGMVLDITACKRAEEALRDADRRKNEFLGVLSHELRNPLTPIRNSIYVLDRVPADSPHAASAKETIQRQTEHLARIVDDLLDVTRISRGRVELRCKRIDLRDVVLRSGEDHRALFEQGKVELRHDLPASAVWIDADGTRISQVLGNLLQNAARFTPASGVVTVKVAVRDGAAELRVRDTGVGMRAEEFEHMFEPFAQADQGLARTQGGLGLGLALSKGLVELHGGTLRACSDGPGRGSEFCMLLPLTPGPVVGEAAPRTAGSAGGRLVLIIDDDFDTGQSLKIALELNGQRVRTACDGKTGIATAHDLRPDVVLCDIGLPDIDGYEVARTLRADEALHSTRLIALSGYARPEDKKRAKEAGFDAHIPKPPELDELTEMLGRP
jgi:PAS domain S-box-containing protein